MSNTETYLFCNDKYGIYYGEKVSYDPETRVAEVKNCRHICRWHGRNGGITSLAAYGICGPSGGDSRIGAAAPESTLTGIVNVFSCSPVARQSIEAHGSKNES